jgi:hypothetical protein
MKVGPLDVHTPGAIVTSMIKTSLRDTLLSIPVKNLINARFVVSDLDLNST